MVPYVTSVSKKLGQIAIVYHYCVLSKFFFKQTLQVGGQPWVGPIQYFCGQGTKSKKIVTSNLPT